MATFEEIVGNTHKTIPMWVPPDRMLSLDPGETTGWAFFERLSLHSYGQAPTGNEAFADELELLINTRNPQVLVMENYRVYAHKTEQHTWSNLHTPQLIGAVRYICLQRHIPVFLQMAQQAKGFCTNDKLKQWGMYPKGAKHASDAIRHGCYWLLFNRRW